MLIEAWGKEVQRKLETVGFQQCFGLEGRLFVCRYQAKSSQHESYNLLRAQNLITSFAAVIKGNTRGSQPVI